MSKRVPLKIEVNKCNFHNFTSAAYFHFGYMIDAPRFRLRHIVSASGRIMATVFSPSDENKQKAKNIGRLVDDKEEILLQKDSDDSSETVGSVISNSQLVKISQRRDESQACGEHDSWNMEHEKVASIPTKEWEDVLKTQNKRMQKMLSENKSGKMRKVSVESETFLLIEHEKREIEICSQNETDFDWEGNRPYGQR